MSPILNHKKNREWEGGDFTTFRRRAYRVGPMDTIDAESLNQGSAMPNESGFTIARVSMEDDAETRGRVAIVTGAKYKAWA